MTTASASSTAYKTQIRDQVGAATPLLGRGVELQLAFVVGPRRTWSNLWKATIDSLGAILGRDDVAHEWNARDGRITSLGLHCCVDEAVGNGVHLAIRASALDACLSSDTTIRSKRFTMPGDRRAALALELRAGRGEGSPARPAHGE